MPTGWWPQLPREIGFRPVCERLPAQWIFPSGRAAIAQSLEAVGLSPQARIAVPSHVSDCLVRVVRRFGAPLDLERLGPDVEAIVVYEQWGWPLIEAAWDQLAARFRGRLLVVDRVDSADFFCRASDPRCPSVEILSLSKLFGIDGGGLARSDGSYLTFVAQPPSAVIDRLRGSPEADLSRGGYRELFKEGRQAVHPSAMAWLERNSVLAAAEAERLARQQRLQALLNCELSANWPAWMAQAVRRGAGPVWAPLLRGQDATRRWTAMSLLDRRFGLVSASTLFNWSGDPLRPSYEMCLAVPIHGQVCHFDQVIEALSYASGRRRNGTMLQGSVSEDGGTDASGS